MNSVFPLEADKVEILKGILERDFTDSLMIIGSSKSCKTSLLMQAAVSEADSGSQVLFVSPQKLSKLPASIHGMQQPSSHTMKNIHFLYAKSSNELQGYLSSLHLRPLPDKPSVIIVDDLNYYCSSADGDSLNELVSLSKLSGLIHEAAFFPHYSQSLKENDGPRMPGFSIMSWNIDSKSSSVKLPDLEEVAKKTCQQVWTIKGRSKSEIQGGSYKMESENNRGTFAITFSLKNVNPTSQVIFLQDILMHKRKETLSGDD